MQDTELKEIVAKNIAALRTLNKMTQLDLGNALSYSDKAVSKWERGESIPDAYVLLKMSELFGCTVDYLLKSHVKDEKLPKAKTKVNHVTVTLITLLGIWTVAALAFVVIHLAGYTYPLIFQYAFFISTIVLTVFNALWGKRIYGFFIISALVWSIFVSIYFIFLWIGKNYWELLMLGIPSQLIVLLCFFVKHRGHYVFASKVK